MKKTFIILILLFLIADLTKAQSQYQPYSYQFYQKLNKDIYSPSTRLHTSLKPYIIDDSSSFRHTYDSLMQRGVDTGHKSWGYRKLFNEHLIDVKNKEFTFYLDYMPDNVVGYDFSNKTKARFKPFGYLVKTPYGLNTRGFQVGGTIGSKFFFYTSGFENQASFTPYLNNYIAKAGVVSGQNYDRTANSFLGAAGNSTHDWAYVTSLLGYSPVKTVSIEMGIDKTFIGDGYRSMLLSDFASNYPLLRLSVDLGKNVRYMAMWTYMTDPKADLFAPPNPPYRKKWGVFHYIDWNINNRASLGFFNALIAADANNDGSRHGFDVNFINPVVFSRSLAPSGGIADNTLIGFTGKYKVLDKTVIYGQLLFDQSSPNASGKHGLQLGFRGADLFKVKSFNYLFEYNTATPYTYSNQYPLVNYANFSEPLAHPYGANFKEWLGILNYSLGRLDFQGQLNYARYGLNTGNINYGKDVLQPDNGSAGSNTGQGLITSLKYAEGKISYLLNPKFNLRLEIGGLFRQEKNSQFINNTKMITFGLRSSFRNIYTDF